MSRPLRFVLPVLFLAVALAFSSCVGTIYDHTYSNRRNYFKPPTDKKEVSAGAILSELDKKDTATTAPGADAGLAPAPGLPPAGADIPGLPPATPPPAGLPDPAAPAAPGAAPAIPGLPPAAPGAPATPPPAVPPPPK
jgi:hypothetical protein